MGGDGAVLSEELRRARAAGADGHRVILVEGASDLRALAALGRRLGRDLASEGVAIVATTGVTNLDRFLRILGPDGYDVGLAGLCDQPEAGELRTALASAGLTATTASVSDLEAVGFFVCVRDLEDELVRALGPEAMTELIEAQGHLRRFHSFQNQPAQRQKTVEAQIRRWLGNHKIRYAPLMVDALALDAVPRPLIGVLDRV
jgi:NAD(P)-dependent dehydrogenase (short-subunit alcohol dehydrogenase family)